MSTVDCIIIDDEPIARNILRDFIGRDERLMLKGNFKSAGDALKENFHHPLLIFLDINMPKISGFEMLRSLPYQPYVIFTTAYREYALEGFDLNAVDYLLKPFSFERFLQAVNKLFLVLAAKQQAAVPAGKDDYIFIKSEGKLVRINIEDIFYIEALKEYVKICTVHGNYVTYQSMHHLEEKLSQEKFFRVHRSYIVAMQYVQMIEGNTVLINKTTLPVSRNYKDEFIERIAKDKLL